MKVTSEHNWSHKWRNMPQVPKSLFAFFLEGFTAERSVPSSVSIKTSYGLASPGFYSQQRQYNFSSPVPTRPALSPKEPPI